MEKLKNITPGEILLEEFLVPLSITQYRLSKELGIPQTRVSEIVKGNRRNTEKQCNRNQNVRPGDSLQNRIREHLRRTKVIGSVQSPNLFHVCSWFNSCLHEFMS